MTTIVIASLVIIFSIVAASVTVDNSYDGNNYHKPIVGLLKNGWNPISQNAVQFGNSPENPIRLQDDLYYEWADHYAKAHWIFAANVYSLTNNIESGKSMGWIVAFSLLFLALAYLWCLLGKTKALIVASIIALNPVSVCQMFSFYNDDILGNLIISVIAILSAVIFLKPESRYKYTHFLLFMVIVLSINTKFNGLAYVGICCFVYLLYLLIARKRGFEPRRLAITCVLSLLFGVFVIGWSAYPRNFIDHGDAVYPLNTIVLKDTAERQQPMSFKGLGETEKFFVANFSKTDDISLLLKNSPIRPELKVPFTIDEDEVEHLKYVDTRIGGYGVWFGGILLVSIAIILTYCVRVVRKKNYPGKYALLLPLLVLSATIIVIPNMWWARYFPQLYIIPVLAVLVLSFQKKYNIFFVALIFALVFNIGVIMYSQLSDQADAITKRNTETKAIDLMVSSSSDRSLGVYAGELGGYVYNLHDRYHKLNILPAQMESNSFVKTHSYGGATVYW